MQIAGKRARHAAWGVPLALAVLIACLYFRAQPHWLADPDAQDYAQLGRQLAQGRGPVTGFMPWNAFDFYAERGVELTTWPNITRFPLMPALMGLAFAAFGPNDESVHLPAILGYVLAAAGAGLLGARVYGVWPALVAGLATATLPMLVNYTLTGLTEPLLGALTVLAAACVVRGGVSLALLGGALLGLAILARYDAGALNLPILGLWLLRGPDRVRRTSLFLLAQAIIVLPWSAYLVIHTGSPLFSIQTASIATQAGGVTDGLGWYEPVYATVGDVFAANPARAWQHFVQELLSTPDRLRKLIGWPLALAGLAAVLLDLVPSVRRRSGGLGLLLFAAVALKALTISVVGLSLVRYFVPFVPLLLVVVAGHADLLLRVLAGRLPATTLLAGRAALLLLLVVPSLRTLGPLLVPPDRPHGPPTRTGEVEARPENLLRLAELVPPDAIVAANVPWSVAWQADRRAVPLAPVPSQITDLERRFGLTIDAIYLAGQVSIVDAPNAWREWEELRRRGTAPPGYALAESFPNGGRLYLRMP